MFVFDQWRIGLDELKVYNQIFGVNSKFGIDK